MSIQDEEFIKRLQATFRVEADEHLHAISSGLLALEKLPSSDAVSATIEIVYREAHTLKGAARVVDFQDIESLCQTLEETFSAWKRRQAIPSPATFNVLHKSLDMIRARIASPETGQNVDVRRQRDELIRHLQRQSHDVPGHREITGVEPVRGPVPLAEHAPSQAVDSERPGASDTMRIPLDKLDACLLQAEDMLTVKAMISQRAAGVSAITATAKRVLVAEDSIISRMLLKSVLESAGYHVKTAADGIDAFTALGEDQFDLIVSDVEMPRMNGLLLTSKIRADKRFGEIPVVLVTALESGEQREQGIDAGANAYVVKSNFDQGNLLEVIRRWI